MECKAFSLSEYQKEELKFVFELFAPKNGKVSVDCAKNMLFKLEESSGKHKNMTRPMLKLAKSEPNSPDVMASPFNQFSNITCFPNGAVECTFEEFALMYEGIMSQTSFEDVLIQAFSLFDVKKNGLIDYKDLQKVAEILGESIQSDEESKRLLNVICPDSRSGISYKEFKDFFINDIKNDEQ